MFSEVAISLAGLGKCYQMYDNPRDRLLQMLMRGRKQYYREFWALRDVALEVGRGEVLGIIGRNGAGKSTLLQLVCGTLNATTGNITVNGRVAALLELGAGFNPEFSGRENVYLAATVMGLTKDEIDARYNEIVSFSGIGDFILQPVKTYSSGMYMRLAFSVATNVDPDILVIDEALSVGDGEFSRRSFDRIMSLKNAGKTILFCSHSMYQVEAICNRIIWLKEGRVELIGKPDKVVVAYTRYMESETPELKKMVGGEGVSPGLMTGIGRLVRVTVSVDGLVGRELNAQCMQSSVRVAVEFASDPSLAAPTVAVGFMLPDGRIVASSCSLFDNATVARDEQGVGSVQVEFPQFPFLKGQYSVVVYLLCECAIHVYDYAHDLAEINVTQQNLEQGIVCLKRHWRECE